VVEQILNHSYLALFFPLAGFIIIGLGLGRESRKLASAVAIAMATLALCSSLALAWAYKLTVLEQPGLYPDQTLVATRTSWLNFAPGMSADMGVLLDPISVMMLLVVTSIAFLVTIYSIGYMRHDPGFVRFFALLDLFVFAMLGLVLATNILQMFVFWELVGVSSYTLIGFWYEKPAAVAAAKKAFIVTRFADAFFLLGIIVISQQAGGFDFSLLNSPAIATLLNHQVAILGLDVNLLSLTSLLIFAGGWGKSAMFPLHVWLPDAMEGPTPVSSIIHSATMVVAGVYLTARMFPLFAAAPGTLTVIMTVGALTALFAAVIAITQKDIKRILAFSTLSQLGYMMFSLGVAKTTPGGDILVFGYSASMFHVFTHAFFKCMLFLGAGAVIHAVHAGDLEQMGGLRRRLPWTYCAMLTACLAIAGIFPFSGFWSKDAILLAALASGHLLVFAVALVTGGLTAFYMFRLFFLTFHGAPRHGHTDPEDPWMTCAIVILTVPTVFAGGLEHLFTATVIPALPAPLVHSQAAWLPWLASGVGLTAIAGAWALYGQGDLRLATRLCQRLGLAHRIIFNKFYLDEAYLFVTRRLIFAGLAQPAAWFDRQVVDGAMDLCATILQAGGQTIRCLQNGQLQVYLGAAIFGVFFLLTFVYLI